MFTKGNELVISFRGADSGLNRLFDLDDWPAALGKMSSQIQLALRTMFRTLFRYLFASWPFDLTAIHSGA